MTLADILADVMPVQVEDDGAVTVGYDGTVAALREVTIAEGLTLVSLTQVLALDLPLTAEIRERASAQNDRTMLGTVSVIELPGTRADVMMRYNFPAGGLDRQALQTLILMVLAGGAEVRHALTQT